MAQQRQREAYEKEKEKLREFISREGKKYDNPSHQAQVKQRRKRRGEEGRGKERRGGLSILR